MENIKYLLVGLIFGIVAVKSEIIAWVRTQEMFQMAAIHMYGVIGVAVITGVISVYIIKRFNIKTIEGEEIIFQDKVFTKGQIFGGLIFGIGWGITGACLGPIFSQIGAGFAVVIVTLFFAIFGTWTYGALKNKLPH